MTNGEIRERLYSLSDSDYKKFNDKVIRTEYEMLGVRLPALKSFAKEIAKSGAEEFLSSFEPRSYEEILLCGFVLGYAKTDIETVFSYFDPLIEKFDNWAHVDCTVGAMKIFAKHREKVFEHFMPLMFSDGEFQKRTFVVILMDYFTTPEHLDRTLSLLKKIPPNQYYVDMAIAWALSVCFVKDFDKTLAAFDRAAFSEFIYKKTISKCMDSFRITTEQKQILRALR